METVKINNNIKRLQDKGQPVKSVLDIIQNDNKVVFDICTVKIAVP